MSKKTLRILLAIVLIVGGTYAAYYMQLKRTENLQKVTVRLSWVHQAQFAGFYVAQEKGWYKDAGLNVTLLPLDDTKNQVAELNDDAIDMSVMEAHQMLVGVDEGVPLQAVAAIYQINPHVLAARQDSGIARPEDFAGKVIGLAGGQGEGNALFRFFVEQYGDASAVNYINLGFDTIDDFINNRADVIDIYQTDQPYLAQKEGIPLNIISLDAYGFSTYGDVVVVNKNMFSTKGGFIRAFVQATLAGWEYALEHPEEAAEISLKYTEGSYHDINYQRHIMFESLPLIRGSVSRLGQMELVPWSTLYESMKRAGAIEGDFDIREVYTNQFIN